MLYILGVN